MNFRMGFSISAKNGVEVLVKIALNLWMILDITDILTTVSFQPMNTDVFPFIRVSNFLQCCFPEFSGPVFCLLG